MFSAIRKNAFFVVTLEQKAHKMMICLCASVQKL